jgi:pimeloyl-ACP methyl ester carboxylesterase
LSSKTGFAAIGPLRMYYEVHGEAGHPLVLIHGGGSTIESNWSSVLPLFAAHRTVIAVELQAHGHTADVDRPETFEQDADDVAALVRQLNLASVDLFGFSNGGHTAMQLAIRHPAIVRKLVIASASYKREGMIDGFFDMMERASLDNMPAPLKAAFLAVNPDPRALQTMHDKDATRMCGFRDWSDDSLRSITAPTLAINADRDVIKNDHALAMSQLIPNARLMIVPGNHGSYLGEACTIVPGSKIPEMVVRVVEEFLDGRVP